MNAPGKKDMEEIIRHLAVVRTSEPSKFQMSERNRKKWLALQKKSRELRGD